MQALSGVDKLGGVRLIRLRELGWERCGGGVGRGEGGKR